MIKCGRLLVQSAKPLTQKQIEDFVIGSFSALVDLKIFVYGYIYVQNEGIYVVGPVEELRKVSSPSAYLDTDFDFENYINTTTDDIFWASDYLNAEGPTIMRMQR